MFLTHTHTHIITSHATRYSTAVAPRILIEDVEIDGIYCPKGSSVSIATLVAHRLAFNRVVKNGDGNVFRPERWEEDYVRRQTEGIKFPSNDYSFITFSAVRFLCSLVTSFN